MIKNNSKNIFYCYNVQNIRNKGISSLNISLEKSSSDSRPLGGGLSDNSSTEQDIFDDFNDGEEFLDDANDLNNSNAEDDDHSSIGSDEDSIFKDVDSVDGDTHDLFNNEVSPIRNASKCIFFKIKSETQVDENITKNIREYTPSHRNFSLKPSSRIMTSPVAIAYFGEEDATIPGQANSLALTFSDVFNPW